MNWRNLIKKLISTGMSETDIGQAVGLHQTTINRLRRGALKTIQFENGQRLVDLADKVRRDPRKR